MENFIIEITKQLNKGGAQQTRYSVSEDGATLIYGCPAEECALIFTKQDERWVIQRKLTSSDASVDDYFGISVSISSDGSTAIVGAYAKSSYTGAAYIFARSGSVWVQQAKLVASDAAANNAFGCAVSISSDGNTALVGAYLADQDGKSDAGAAYVFTRVGSTWPQQAKLVARDAASGDWFGNSVSISSDGSTAIIGAFNKSSGTGAVYIVTRTGFTWVQQQKLTASDAATGHYFGRSVSISSDGSVIKTRNIHNKDYPFTRVDNKWTETTSHQADKSPMSNEKDTALNNSKTVKHPYNQPSQGFFTGQHQQQPMTPPFHTPFSLPPGMYMPPHHMYPGIHQQHPQQLPAGQWMTNQHGQQNGWVQPPTENLSMRKQLELQQLNNELAPLQYQLGQLQERVKYLQAKIKAIETIPEE